MTLPHDLGGAGGRLDLQLHGNLAVGEAVDADLAGDFHLVLHEDLLVADQLLHRHVFALPRLPEGHRIQPIAQVFQPAGGHLGGRVAGGIGPLGPVGEHDHPQQPFAGLQPQHVFQTGADGRFLALGRAGQPHLAVGEFGLVRFGVEGVDLDLEIGGQLVQIPLGQPQCSQQGLPAGLAVHRVGNRHAPRRVRHHDQRGRLLLAFGIHQRRPEHGQQQQQDDRHVSAASVVRRRPVVLLAGGPKAISPNNTAAASRTTR